MKRLIGTTLLILTLALILGSCASMMTGMMKNKMFKHYESKYDFDKTYETMKSAIEGSDRWTILGEYDNQERYSSEGALPNYKVLQICNPFAAYRILNDDETKYMGGMIPLKFCIYEKNDGTVWMSMMNVEMMGSMFDDEQVVETIEGASGELMTFIEKIQKED